MWTSIPAVVEEYRGFSIMISEMREGRESPFKGFSVQAFEDGGDGRTLDSVLLAEDVAGENKVVIQENATMAMKEEIDDLLGEHSEG